jgi:hypothetical protein
MVYGKVGKPFWDDRPVAVIGGGPSLQDFDYEVLRGAHVLAVKSAIFGIPWADAGFGLDITRYQEWRERLADVQARIYWAVSESQLTQTGAPAKNITFLRQLYGPQLSEDPGVIYSDGTSGFGALQICIHKRAKQIVLFGFDYDGVFSNAVADARGQKRRDQRAAHWREWAEHFSIFSPYFSTHGISVFNACPTSAIRSFQKVGLWDGVEIVRRKNQ